MSDLIDKQKVIDALNKIKIYRPLNSDRYVISDCLNKIVNLPNVEAEPVKHGRWVPVTNGRGGFECSICHSYAPSYQDGVEWLSLYCPNCGAKMDAKEGEE